ncbi:hypothetical protein EON63_07710 [archaeon]|nr:MAG: hypothetical protein EON63_07710 [archaeon]
MKKLLNVLECPFIDVFPANLDDLLVKDQVTLICWLEDRSIREFELNDRKGMRVTHPNCLHNIANYLITLGCPFPWNTNTSLTANCAANLDAVRWLIEHAIQLTYEDAYGDEGSEMDCGDSMNNNGDNDGINGGGEDGVSEEEVAVRVDRLGEMMGVDRVDGEDSVGKYFYINVHIQVYIHMHIL